MRSDDNLKSPYFLFTYKYQIFCQASNKNQIKGWKVGMG